MLNLADKDNFSVIMQCVCPKIVVLYGLYNMQIKHTLSKTFSVDLSNPSYFRISMVNLNKNAYNTSVFQNSIQINYNPSKNSLDHSLNSTNMSLTRAPRHIFLSKALKMCVCSIISILNILIIPLTTYFKLFDFLFLKRYVKNLLLITFMAYFLLITLFITYFLLITCV